MAQYCPSNASEKNGKSKAGSKMGFALGPSLFLKLVLCALLIQTAAAYSKPYRTTSGKNCVDCLQASKNHCLLGQREGICCDKDDPECAKTAYNYSPDNPCAHQSNYDFKASLWTCPQAERCPQGNRDLYINEYDKAFGFSDQWGWFNYNAFSICKFRIHSDKPKSNLLLNLVDINGEVEFTLMIMQKNRYQFPQYVFSIKRDSTQRSFNVSADYFEYFLYIMPDSFQSAAYSVTAKIEKQYVPEAFKPIPPPPEAPKEKPKEEPPKKPATETPPPTLADPVDTKDSKPTPPATEGKAPPKVEETTTPVKPEPSPKPTESKPAASGTQQSQAAGIVSAGNKDADDWSINNLLKDKSFVIIMSTVFTICFITLCCSCIGCYYIKNTMNEKRKMLEHQMELKRQALAKMQPENIINISSQTSPMISQQQFNEKMGQFVRLKNGKSYKVSSFILDRSQLDNSRNSNSQNQGMYPPPRPSLNGGQGISRGGTSPGLHYASAQDHKKHPFEDYELNALGKYQSQASDIHLASLSDRRNSNGNLRMNIPEEISGIDGGENFVYDRANQNGRGNMPIQIEESTRETAENGKYRTPTGGLRRPGSLRGAQSGTSQQHSSTQQNSTPKELQLANMIGRFTFAASGPEDKFLSQLHLISAEKIQKEFREDNGDFSKCTQPAHHIHRRFDAQTLRTLLETHVLKNEIINEQFENSTEEQAGNSVRKEQQHISHISSHQIPDMLSHQPNYFLDGVSNMADDKSDFGIKSALAQQIKFKDGVSDSVPISPGSIDQQQIMFMSKETSLNKSKSVNITQFRPRFRGGDDASDGPESEQMEDTDDPVEPKPTNETQKELDDMLMSGSENHEARRRRKKRKNKTTQLEKAADEKKEFDDLVRSSSSIHQVQRRSFKQPVGQILYDVEEEEQKEKDRTAQMHAIAEEDQEMSASQLDATSSTKARMRRRKSASKGDNAKSKKRSQEAKQSPSKFLFKPNNKSAGKDEEHGNSVETVAEIEQNYGVANGGTLGSAAPTDAVLIESPDFRRQDRRSRHNSSRDLNQMSSEQDQPALTLNRMLGSKEKERSTSDLEKQASSQHDKPKTKKEQELEKKQRKEQEKQAKALEKKLKKQKEQEEQQLKQAKLRQQSKTKDKKSSRFNKLLKRVLPSFPSFSQQSKEVTTSALGNDFPMFEDKSDLDLQITQQDNFRPDEEQKSLNASDLRELQSIRESRHQKKMQIVRDHNVLSVPSFSEINYHADKSAAGVELTSHAMDASEEPELYVISEDGVSQSKQYSNAPKVSAPKTTRDADKHSISSALSAKDNLSTFAGLVLEQQHAQRPLSTINAGGQVHLKQHSIQTNARSAMQQEVGSSPAKDQTLGDAKDKTSYHDGTSQDFSKLSRDLTEEFPLSDKSDPAISGMIPASKNKSSKLASSSNLTKTRRDRDSVSLSSTTTGLGVADLSRNLGNANNVRGGLMEQLEEQGQSTKIPSTINASRRSSGSNTASVTSQLKTLNRRPTHDDLRLKSQHPNTIGIMSPGSAPSISINNINVIMENSREEEDEDVDVHNDSKMSGVQKPPPRQHHQIGGDQGDALQSPHTTASNPSVPVTARRSNRASLDGPPQAKGPILQIDNVSQEDHSAETSNASAGQSRKSKPPMGKKANLAGTKNLLGVPDQTPTYSVANVDDSLFNPKLSVGRLSKGTASISSATRSPAKQKSQRSQPASASKPASRKK